MSRALIYDGLRLFLGATKAAPRGIDRVDLLYAQYLYANWPGECFGLLPTPWGIRLFPRDRGRRLINAIEARWQETTDPTRDEQLTHVRHRLMGQTTELSTSSQTQPVQPIGPLRALRRELALLADTGFTLGKSAARSAARDAIYLNIGQLGLAAPWIARWLRRRDDVKPVFLLHDVIPFLLGDLVSPSGRTGHRWIVDTIKQHAVGVITTTQHAEFSITAALQGNRRGVSIYSSHLPVADVFLRRPLCDNGLVSRPYFVAYGAIEPRKNYGLLFRVWQRLVDERSDAAPSLVIAGSPGYRAAEILQQFEDSPNLRHHVIIVSGLSSPGLLSLISHAHGVLAPSFAEGFGLVLAEALAAGTPVLASDLPAHREVGGGHAAYADPSDDVAWHTNVCQLVDHRAFADNFRRQAANFQPMTEARYFAGAQAFLESLG